MKSKAVRRRRPQLTPREQQALDAFKARLLHTFNGGVARLLLFGSKARGDAHQRSDVDLLLVLRRDDRRAQDALADMTLDIMMEYHIDLSVMTLSQREFRRLSQPPTSFMYTVLHDGIRLV